MFKNSAKVSKKIILLACLTLAIFVVSSIIGVTIAYLNGRITVGDDSGVTYPYIDIKMYYNNNIVENDTISGEIDGEGNVTLFINGSEIDPLNCMLSLKNSGNINAELLSLMLYIEFYEGENLLVGYDNSFITFTVSTNGLFKVGSETIFTFDEILLNKDGTTVEFLSKINIDNSKLQYSHTYFNKTFKIVFIYDAGQENIEDL